MVTTAIVHDYLTQRGGAERVVLSMARAFPDAAIYTSVYEPSDTYPAFASLDVRPSVLNRTSLVRRHHRLGLLLYPWAFGRLDVDADVAICSTSGWAHGVHTSGKKVVYCHTPARWLYDTDTYLGGSFAAGAAGRMLAPLRRWDRASAASAMSYLANSTVVRDRIRAIYGIDATVVHPPVTFDVNGDVEEPADLDGSGGYVLCVSRLLGYKNVEPVVEAFRQLPQERLVVAGDGPLLERLRARAPANVRLVGSVSDPQLRWLYTHSSGLVAAAYEDFGLTPLEALAFGKPTAALRGGGFLDTVREGETGLFFDEPHPDAIARAVTDLARADWDPDVLAAHVARFSEARFHDELRSVVEGLG